MSTCTCPGPLYPGIHECPDRDDPITAAARAWHARQQAGRTDVGRDRGDGRPAQWDDLTETDRRAARAFVRPLVDAALRAAGVES